jgi:hypothetical protein
MTISGFLRGQFVQNVICGLYTPISTQTDFESAFKAGRLWVEGIGSQYLDCLPVDYIGSSVRAQVFSTGALPDEGPAATIQLEFNGQPGTRTGTLAVTSIGPIIVCPFEVSGRPRSGKIFLPGVTETDVNNNRLTDELLTAIAAFTDLLINDITDGDGNTWKFKVYSPLEGNMFPPEGMYVSTQVGSIRQRQRPHG